MIELVQVFSEITTRIYSVLYFKMKKLGYTEAMLLVYKHRQNYNLPSFTSTMHLGKNDWPMIESNMYNMDHLNTEKEYIKFLNNMFRHNGQPQEFLSC